MQSFAIQCSQLKKTYAGRTPVEAVRGIDLEVHVGECFGFLGPNGAGKTTTIEILEGLLEPTSGSVEILGKRWSQDAAAIRQAIGISLQETQLPEKLSVIETLRLFRSFYTRGLTPEDAMRAVSIEEKSNVWISKLSGGQKQRLAVAAALVGDPELLFLDEPTTGLDPSSRRQLWDIIRSFQKQGRSIMLTTHYMDEAEKLCDRVAVIDNGTIIALGSPRELIASLGGEHVVEFSLQSVPDGAFHPPWGDLPAVTTVGGDDADIVLSTSHPHLTIPALLEMIQENEFRLASIHTRQASLEDVFVSLTGRHLNEDLATSQPPESV